MTAGGAGRLIVLSGPTAVGKTTVVRALRAQHPELWISVSVTTRPPRPGEVEALHYHFVDEATFDKMVAAGEFLEWAVVHGRAKYGTPREPVQRALAAGTAVLLEIDLQGARQVKATWPDAVFVFLAPPSWKELVRRLVGRATERQEEQDRRLATAREELAAEPEFDLTLVNHDVQSVCEQLVALMNSPATSRPEA